MILKSKLLFFLSVLWIGPGSTIAFAQQPVYSIVGGLEYDSRHSSSITAGMSLIREDCSSRILCFKNQYAQILAKYNFIGHSYGLQTAIGFSDIIGGRVGTDLEYSPELKELEFMVFAGGGFDLGGSASLILGPKINLTRNLSDRTLLFHAALHLPIYVRHSDKN